MRSRTDLLTTTLAVTACVGLLEALAAGGFGLWLVAQDLQEHTDEFDGLGVAIGLFIAGPAGIALVLLGTAMYLLRRGSTLASGLIVSLVGACAALPLVPVLLTGNGYPPAVVVGLTGAALLTSGIALALRREGG